MNRRHAAVIALFLAVALVAGIFAALEAPSCVVCSAANIPATSATARKRAITAACRRFIGYLLGG